VIEEESDLRRQARPGEAAAAKPEMLSPTRLIPLLSDLPSSSVRMVHGPKLISGITKCRTHINCLQQRVKGTYLFKLLTYS
jgi:hypothetical protein